MPIRSRYMAVFDVVMRVPPLFVLDSVLNRSFLLFFFPEFLSSEESVINLKALIWILVSLICFICALLIFFLPTEQLIYTYTYLISLGMVAISYVWNRNMAMKLSKPLTLSEDPGEAVTQHIRTFLINLTLQLGLSYNFNNLRVEPPWMRREVYTNYLSTFMRCFTYSSYLLPSLCKFVGLPDRVVCNMPMIAMVFPIVELLLLLVTKLKHIYHSLLMGYMLGRYAIRHYGIQGYIENQWIRLNVPDVLRVFWITRFVYQVILLSGYQVFENYNKLGYYTLSVDNLWAISRLLLVYGCDTVISLSGMTSVVSYITQNIGLLFAGFVGSENEEGQNMGSVSAILFFILALQTGLTGLDADKRVQRLYRNFCLLSTAILHFVHSMVYPLLMSLSASRNTSVSKHSRVLTMCAFLIIFPSCFLYYLWTQHTVSTWLLAVTAFSIEVILKVVISLLQYTLFMVDACRDTFWEELDDYVYYVRSTGSTIEFFFGIFLFCNGAWIMVFESGGTIRACMMCIHAYFNIWVQAKEGWKTFMRRRTAVNKINSLPSATSAEIDLHNDVCAICYQELKTARITRCHHFFHGVCLRKWLYVQDRCPLCHEVIYSPEDLDSEKPSEAQHEWGQENGADAAAEDPRNGDLQNNNDIQPNNIRAAHRTQSDEQLAHPHRD
ncbi:protein TRC8 homolog [Lineus longissimus]|uniref:protein TRC8 homolog n=1 Tax=Lineus longissimus TaxID=88925 RepID=UPI00315D8F7C